MGLRAYLPDGHPDKGAEIGTEPSPQEYVDKLLAVFREVRRVLHPSGCVFLNLGDSYAGSWGNQGRKETRGTQRPINGGMLTPVHDGRYPTTGSNTGKIAPGWGLKAKDLMMIPSRVAIALQDDGWWLRSEIIWCLSGGNWLYVQTKNGGVCLMMVKDLARLDPANVKLWNGEKWTQLLGMSKSERRGDEIEIVLRSGERVSCTPTHKFPTDRGLIEASQIRIGDKLRRVRLPDTESPRDCALDEDAAWFAGLYLAEGSRHEDCVSLAGHAREDARWQKVQRIAAKFGGSAMLSVDGNRQTIRVHSRVLSAIVDEFVCGRVAIDKGFSPNVWRYSNKFVAAMLDGYLSGDGHYDEPNDRWRLRFCRNYNLERDLRVVCARLGYRLALKPTSVPYNGSRVPTFRGEIRKNSSDHWNTKSTTEVVAIQNARCRYVYDLGVEDEPHLFALSSGILTHNSKAAPMPESVRDRPTCAHEKVFLLTRSERYFYDADAVAESASTFNRQNTNGLSPKNATKQKLGYFSEATGLTDPYKYETRNLRNVWHLGPEQFSGAHFATMPATLAERCIKAGSRPGDTVLDPFAGAGTTLLVADRLRRHGVGIELSPEYLAMARRRIEADGPLFADVA